MIKPVFLATDLALFVLLIALVCYVAYVRRTPPLRAQWARVFMARSGMASAVVLAVVLALSLLDSLHYRTPLPNTSKSAGGGSSVQAYSPKTTSALEALLNHLKAGQEKTYSQPLSSTQTVKETALIDGKSVRDNPPLKFGGAHLRGAEQRGEIADAVTWLDVAQRSIVGAVLGAAFAGFLLLLWLAVIVAGTAHTLPQARSVLAQSRLPWATGFVTLGVLCVVGGALWQVSQGWHVLGTDRAGNDMLYSAIKSIRTALVIGVVSVVVSLPFALVLGIAAGTLRGWVDTAIQYVYTTLSSIPGILLIAACVLLIQSYIDNNPTSYPTALERADVKLFLLCMVLGLTSWAGLARLLRAEAMKLRELDYVLAARSFGVPMWQIMLRHIAPNTLHLVILTVSMEFSGYVLYEAMLSYIGIGVDPAIQSFGGMINGARTELSRNPMVWWPLFSAFIFMLGLVLAANLFADCVHDAFDPKAAVGGKV
jgi:peptide/nickel transport system permease protein